MRHLRILKIAAFIILIAGNASAEYSGPGYLADSIPGSWQMTEQCHQTLPPDDGWWKTFNDPILETLMEKAVANNYNVAAAIKRIHMADKAVKEAQSAYFPTLTATAGWQREQQSGAIVHPASASSATSYFSLGASMNWEIDVFGRVGAAVKGKRAAYNATRADYEAVMVSLCAGVATAYMQLRTCQEELAVADAHIKSQEEVVRITEARYEADLGNMLDVTQARIVLYGTQSSVPTLKARIRTLKNSISVLLGEYPESLADILADSAALPSCRHTIDAGVPSDLLRRRPDVVAAEMELAEYAAAIGVAKKDFLPVLTLAGSIGTESHSAGSLFGDHSLSYSVAPQLSWTIFDGLARNHRTAEAKLQMEAAVDNYNLTVMNAVSEVDNALIDYSAILQSIDLQQRVVEASKKSLDLSVDLYKSGLTAFSNVVDGQMNWLESQNSLVELQGKALTTLITVYKALGGGWKY